jgi:EamA domain-containing membrane protein RarD
VPTSVARSRAFTPQDTVLLLSLGAMWGLSFLFIEVALRGLTPIWIVAGRTLIGAAFLLLVLQLRGQGLPRSLHLWRHLIVLGVVSNALPWGAVAWAQQALPSGLVALLMALVPTSTLVVSVLVGMERFSRARTVESASEVHSTMRVRSTTPAATASQRRRRLRSEAGASVGRVPDTGSSGGGGRRSENGDEAALSLVSVSLR